MPTIPSLRYVMYYSELQVGIKVVTGGAGTKTVKVMLLQCSVDLPALSNRKQFNGKWGCLYCYNPGKQPPTVHYTGFGHTIQVVMPAL